MVRLAYFVGALFLCAVISFIGARIVVLDTEVSQAQETTKAVCLFRDGLVDSAKTTEAYAKAHPEGIPSLHFTQRQLFNNARVERERADSLAGLHCPPAPHAR